MSLICGGRVSVAGILSTNLRSARPEHPGVAGATGAAGDVDPGIQEALDLAIADLSAEDRELLELRFARGLTYPQLFAATGLSRSTLRDRLQGIPKALRERGIG